MTTASAQRLPRSRYGNPRLRRTNDVLRYWAERIDLIAPEHERFSMSSMICESDSLYHYGHHFELARIIRDKRGRTRLVLLNGDTYRGSGGSGPSTSARQHEVRSEAATSGAPSLVVPFSALEGAGIDFDSIMPIQVREDWWTEEDHSSHVRPNRKHTTMPDPSGATTTETYWDYGSKPVVQREREVPLYVKNPNQTRGWSVEHGWSDGATRGEDGIWRWTVRRHWLGDAVFRARYTERRTRKATAEEIEHHEAHLAWMRESDRLHAIEDREHRRAWRLDRRFGFKGDYRHMTRALFAAVGFEERAERARVDRYDLPSVYGIGMLPGNRMSRTVTRWATFLSSFDYQESNPLYFLCELPYGAKPSTVDEAVEALKPPEVTAALARGLKVIRQGDLFAIPTKLTKRQIRRMRGSQDFTKRLRVLGTNHSVTEGIVLKGGAVLGRGVMRHEPEGWRPPDHAQQKLGDAWHLLVRNTVPRTH